jgi:hypothetical protein
MTYDRRAMPSGTSDLPGTELVRAGLEDLRAGRDTESALLVQVAAPRLRALGFDVPQRQAAEPAEHRLYALLAATYGDGAHSRYNARGGRAAERARRAQAAPCRERRARLAAGLHPEAARLAGAQPRGLRRGQRPRAPLDFYSQALPKIERGFAQDLDDVASMPEAPRPTPASPSALRSDRAGPVPLPGDRRRGVPRQARRGARRRLSGAGWSYRLGHGAR